MRFEKKEQAKDTQVKPVPSFKRDENELKRLEKLQRVIINNYYEIL